MRKAPEDHTVKRIHRTRGRRGRFWAGVASVVIFAGLLSMTAAGLTYVGFESRPVEQVEQARTESGRGRIVQIGSDSCSKTDFNNKDGHFSDRQYIQCPENRDMRRDYQYPVDRMEKFSKGFFK